MGNPTCYPERSVLCRTCMNWTGRQSGAERRGSLRTCKAGVATHYQLMSCDSYVPVSVTAGAGHPLGPGLRRGDRHAGDPQAGDR